MCPRRARVAQLTQTGMRRLQSVMRRVLACLACAVVGVASVERRQSSVAALLPLIVERTMIVPPDQEQHIGRRIATTVRNNGTKTIVAWGLRGELRLVGQLPRVIGFTVDGYEVQTGCVRGRGEVLAPDAQFTEMLQFPTDELDVQIEDMRISASAVVFDDDSAIGDQKDIGFFFDRRATSRREWAVAEKVLTAAMDAHPGATEALDAAERDWNAAVDDAMRKGRPMRIGNGSP